MFELKIPQNYQIEKFGDQFIKINQIAQLKIPNKLKIELTQEHHYTLIRTNQVQLKYWISFKQMILNCLKGLQLNYTQILKLVGIGYRVQLLEINHIKYLSLKIKYSNKIYIKLPSEITVLVKDPYIILMSWNKQFVGEIANKIRHLEIPEVYKNKGILYLNEIPRHKIGKQQ